MLTSTLCACGCGQATPLATKTSTKRGVRRGQPLKFISGHNLREMAQSRRVVDVEPPNPSGLCFCGCGQVTRRARQSDRIKGDVAGEYLRFVGGHQSRGPLGDEERFESYVYPDPNSGCFIWSGAEDKDGYGVFYRRGTTKQWSAHRAAWVFRGRALPEPPLVLRHKCNNRLCVNVDHLEIGTPRDNITDMVRAQRGVRSRAGLKYGVTRSESGNFQSRLAVLGRCCSFGTYSTEEQAHRVAVFVRDIVHGFGGMC